MAFIPKMPGAVPGGIPSQRKPQAPKGAGGVPGAGMPSMPGAPSNPSTPTPSSPSPMAMTPSPSPTPPGVGPGAVIGANAGAARAGAPLTSKIKTLGSGTTARAMPNTGMTLSNLTPGTNTTGGERTLAKESKDGKGGGAGSEGEDPLAMYNSLISSMQADSEKERAEIQKNAALAGNRDARMAGLLNARLGRSIAGGYASLQGQAAIGNQESLRKALAEQSLRSGDKLRQMQLAYLDKQIQERNLQREHAWDVEGREDTQGHEADMLGSEVNTTPSYEYKQFYSGYSDQLSGKEQARYNELLKDYEATGSQQARDEMRRILEASGIDWEQDWENQSVAPESKSSLEVLAEDAQAAHKKDQEKAAKGLGMK